METKVFECSGPSEFVVNETVSVDTVMFGESDASINLVVDKLAVEVVDVVVFIEIIIFEVVINSVGAKVVIVKDSMTNISVVFVESDDSM